LLWKFQIVSRQSRANIEGDGQEKKPKKRRLFLIWNFLSHSAGTRVRGLLLCPGRSKGFNLRHTISDRGSRYGKRRGKGIFAKPASIGRVGRTGWRSLATGVTHPQKQQRIAVQTCRARRAGRYPRSDAWLVRVAFDCGIADRTGARRTEAGLVNECPENTLGQAAVSPRALLPGP
jgi:hypothetical protein